VLLWANFCRAPTGGFTVRRCQAAIYDYPKLRAMLRCVLCRTGLAARGPLFMSGQGEPEHGQGLRSHAEYGARVLPTNALRCPAHVCIMCR
jgi:hypothetical protein